MALIDSLTPQQVATVKAKTLKDARPKFYSPNLDGLFTPEGEAIDPEVQISSDLETVLILLPTKVKKSLLTYLTSSSLLATGEDEIELMSEVVESRSFTLDEAVASVSGPINQYQESRTSVVQFVTEVAGQRAVDLVLPELGQLFGLGGVVTSDIARADVTAIHNRIADVGVFNAYTGGNALREMTSWIRVLTTYL